MDNHRPFLPLAAIFLLISTGVSLAAISKPINPAPDSPILGRYPVTTVPLIKATPKIDGTLHDQEWNGAATIFPLGHIRSGEIIVPNGLFKIAYTEDAIVLGFRVDRPTDRNDMRQPIEISDRMELQVRDLFGLDHHYSFVIDFAGRRMDAYTKGTQESTNRLKEWNGKIRRLKQGYEGEMAIPFTYFKRSTPKSGDTWEWCLIHHRTRPYPVTLSNVVHGARQNAKDMAYMKFGGATTPTVGMALDLDNEQATITIAGQVLAAYRVETTLHAVPKVGRQYYEAFDARINPAGTLRPTFDIVDLKPQLKEILATHKKIKTWSETLGVDREKPGSLMVDLKQPPGDYLLDCRIIDDGTKAIVASGVWPIHLGAGLTAQIWVAPLQVNALVVKADYSRLHAIPSAAEAVVRVRRTNRNTILAEERVAAQSLIRQSILTIPLNARLTGELEVEVSLEQRGRDKIVSMTEVVNVPTKPDWWTRPSQAGARVTPQLSPWPAIQVDDTSATVWGRKITFDKQMLPTRITHDAAASDSVDMLADDIQLVINGSRRVSFGTPKFVDRGQWAYTRTADLSSLSGGLRGSLTMTMDMDGFMRYTLDLSSAGSRPIPISRLSLLIPIPTEIAAYYQAGPGDTAADGLHSAWSAGTIPKDGMSFPFTSQLWVGNRNLGFDLTMESDQHWNPLSRPDAIRLTPDQEGTTLLQIDMIDRTNRQRPSKSQTGDLRFEWGLLPTPAKPRAHNHLQRLRLVKHIPDVHRLTQRVDTGRLDSVLSDVAKLGANGLLIAGDVDARDQARKIWNPEVSVPGLEPRGDRLSWRQQGLIDAISASRRAGMSMTPVQILRDVPDAWADLQPYAGELTSFPTYGTGTASRYNPTPAFQAWYLKALEASVSQYGTHHIYTDSSPVSTFSANLITGDGWFDDEGRLRGKYPIFANREFHKTLWQALHGGLVRDGILIAGNMPYMVPTVESFVDVHVTVPYTSWTDLMRNDPGELFARFYGESRGLPVLVAPGKSHLEPTSRPEAWATMAQLDIGQIALPETLASSSGRASYTGMDSVLVGNVWRVWAAFPWENSHWIPAWSTSSPVSITDPSIQCAVHLNPGKAALVMVSNYHDATVDTTLTLDAKALGFEAGITAVDGILNEPVPLSAEGKIALSVSSARWRLLVLKPTP